MCGRRSTSLFGNRQTCVFLAMYHCWCWDRIVEIQRSVSCCICRREREVGWEEQDKGKGNSVSCKARGQVREGKGEEREGQERIARF